MGTNEQQPTQDLFCGYCGQTAAIEIVATWSPTAEATRLPDEAYLVYELLTCSACDEIS